VVLERAIATLVEVFKLIGSHPSLSRDLNGLLPQFFSALLNLSTQRGLLSEIFLALHILIPDNATIFRPSMARTSALVMGVIDGMETTEVKRLAGRVFVDLHHSAQKGGIAEQWRNSFLGVIAEVHHVLDLVFEIIEEGTLSLEAVN
jgi:rRNA processing/ribosome biogenesis